MTELTTSPTPQSVGKSPAVEIANKMRSHHNNTGGHSDISLRIKKSTNFQQLRLQKIKLKLDIFTLNSILAFIFKDSAVKTRKVLNNLHKLFTNINEEYYADKPELRARFWVIKRSLELLVDDKYESYNSIKADLMDDPDATSMTDAVVKELDKLSIGYEESKKLINKLDDRLRFGYVLTIKEIMQDFIDAIDEDDYNSYKEISDDLFNLATSIVNIKRNTNSLDSDQTFSLDTDKFEEVVTYALEKLRDRMRIFTTGITGLNTLLAPGYMSKRLYLYLAFPGGGKSQILLKSALDIKKYNAHVKAKDPNKHPGILFITMENSIEETVERIFNMEVCPEDIRNFTPKQVIDKLRKGGKLTLTDENNIDIIIKFFPNRSIDTNDLYGIIQDLADDGIETIALILDYIKRIRPAESGNSEKEELKNISNELKNLAAFFDIAVITAQQLNRVASSVVDSAMQAKKEDLAQLIGRDGVAGAWELLENADWVCVLNQEVKRSTDELFMTFKLLKRRYRSADDDANMRRLTYFNQPYEPGNEIRLLDDVGMARPLFVQSLAGDLSSLEDKKRGTHNATTREERKNTQIIQTMDFDPFDDAVTVQFE